MILVLWGIDLENQLAEAYLKILLFLFFKIVFFFSDPLKKQVKQDKEEDVAEDDLEARLQKLQGI